MTVFILSDIVQYWWDQLQDTKYLLQVSCSLRRPWCYCRVTDCSIRVVAVTHQSVTELQWRHITTTTSSQLYCGGVVVVRAEEDTTKSWSCPSLQFEINQQWDQWTGKFGNCFIWFRHCLFYVLTGYWIAITRFLGSRQGFIC